MVANWPIRPGAEEVEGSFGSDSCDQELGPRSEERLGGVTSWKASCSYQNWDLAS